MKNDQVFLQAEGFRVLSRNELKMIKGGPVDPGGGNGSCIGCRCVDNGYHSCWYTKGGPITLCQRVYPDCQSLEINLDGCYSGDGCITN